MHFLQGQSVIIHNYERAEPGNAAECEAKVGSSNGAEQWSVGEEEFSR